MGRRWNPWQALARRRHIRLEFERLDDALGYCETWPEHTVITIDARLGRRDRNAVLAHELIHDERGGGIDFDGSPAGWAAVVAREELIVDGEVARRLVPGDELAELIARSATIDEPVTVDDLVEMFDVPRWVARAALRLAS